MDPLTLASQCLTTFIRKSSEQQLDKESKYTCSEEILQEKRRPLSRLISMLDFFKPFSDTGTCPALLLGSGYDDPDDPPSVQEESLRLKISFVCRFVL